MWSSRPAAGSSWLLVACLPLGLRVSRFQAEFLAVKEAARKAGFRLQGMQRPDPLRQADPHRGRQSTFATPVLI
jgi:hypothetical protein